MWESGNSFFLTDDEEQTYRRMLRGELGRAPNGWWHGDDGYLRGLSCLRYYCEVVSGATTRRAVCAIMRARLFEEAALAGWRVYWRAIAFEGFAAAFPEYELLPWEGAERVPRSYWETHGAPAARAAVRWWMDQEQLTMPDLLNHLRHRTFDMATSLARHGLGGLLKLVSGNWELLRLVDPTLPQQPPESQRSRQHRRRTLVCPWCGLGFEALIPHAIRTHHKRPADLRAILGDDAPLESARIQRLRSMNARQPRRTYKAAPRTTAHQWVTDGLALPSAWWAAPYVRLHVADNHTIQCIPATTSGQGRWKVRLHGHRATFRIRREVFALLRDSTVTPDGTGVTIRLQAPLDRDWLQRKLDAARSVAPDLWIDARRRRILVDPRLFPRDTHAVAVTMTADVIGLMPVTDQGTVAGTATPAPLALKDCYRFRQLGQRRIIVPRGALTALNPTTGAWDYTGTRDQIWWFSPSLVSLTSSQ